MKKKRELEFKDIAVLLEGMVIDSKAFGSRVVIYNGAVYTVERLIIQASDDQMNLLADEAFEQEFGMLPTKENIIKASEIIAQKQNSVII